MNKESQAYKRVRNSNRLILIMSLLGLTAVIALTIFSSAPYWMAQITGPIEISGKEISVLDGSTHLYNRAVSGIDMDDTFYYEETVDEDTGRQVRIDAYFGALEVSDDVWILVRHLFWLMLAVKILFWPGKRAVISMLWILMRAANYYGLTSRVLAVS